MSCELHTSRRWKVRVQAFDVEAPPGRDLSRYLRFHWDLFKEPLFKRGYFPSIEILVMNRTVISTGPGGAALTLRWCAGFHPDSANDKTATQLLDTDGRFMQHACSDGNQFWLSQFVDISATTLTLSAEPIPYLVPEPEEGGQTPGSGTRWYFAGEFALAPVPAIPYINEYIIRCQVKWKKDIDLADELREVFKGLRGT